MRHPESIECVVNPDDFPGDPISIEADLDVTLTAEGDFPRKPGIRWEINDSTSTTTMDTIKPVTSKRRRLVDSSESQDEESDACITRRLRSRKTRILEHTIKDEMVPPHSQTVILSSLMISTGDAGTTLQSEMDTDGVSKKKKVNKKRLSPIAPQIHSIVDVENLRDLTTTNLAALAMDWADDIELIRKRSNMQGVMSKYVKECIELIKECFRIMQDYSLRPDNHDQLQIRNARLAADYLAAQTEITQLRQEINKFEKMMINLPQKDSCSRKVMRNTATFPVRGAGNIKTDDIPKNIIDEITNMKNRICLLETKTVVPQVPSSCVASHQKSHGIAGKPIIKKIEEVNPSRKVTIVSNLNTCISNYLKINRISVPRTYLKISLGMLLVLLALETPLLLILDPWVVLEFLEPLVVFAMS